MQVSVVSYNNRIGLDELYPYLIIPIVNNYGKNHLIAGSNEHTLEKGLAHDQMLVAVKLCVYLEPRVHGVL